MNRWTQLTLAAALALAVSACSGDRAPAADTAANRSGEAGATATSGTTNADAEFVEEQLAMGEKEVELGRLAQQQGTHPEVKRYGGLMVREHTMAGDELKQIAQTANANRTATEGRASNRENLEEVREELAKLSGRDFDRRYIDQMVEDHEKGISDLENKSERADNTQVRQWATKTLPKMRQHLEQAKEIQQTLKNDNR